MLQRPSGTGKTTFMWARECAARDTIVDSDIIFERAVPAPRVIYLHKHLSSEHNEGEIYI